MSASCARAGKPISRVILADPCLSEAGLGGLGSGGEIGHQLYKEFGAGKLDGVDFQSVPTDEAEGAGYGFWRLDAALATLE